MTNNIGNQRILYWDVIKCFAIFTVVWGHCIEFLQPDTSKGWSDPVAARIMSFHMPLFMTVSGYFARSVFKACVWETIAKKGRQLLLPSVSLYFLIGMCLIFLRHKEFWQGLTSLLGYCIVSFWFLKALFIYYVLTCAGIHLWRRNAVYVVVPIILGVFLPVEWLDYAHSISMYPYFVIGLLLYRHETWFFSHQKAIFVITTLIYLFLTNLYPTQEYDMYTHLFAWDMTTLKLYITYRHWDFGKYCTHYPH